MRLVVNERIEIHTLNHLPNPRSNLFYLNKQNKHTGPEFRVYQRRTNISKNPPASLSETSKYRGLFELGVLLEVLTVGKPP